MTTATKTAFKRDILDSEAGSETACLLQANLVNLIDLALLLKQAHWNVIGPNFRSVHLQLDEIIESVRAASDEVAERINTLGIAPDGRSSTVAQDSKLDAYPTDFQKVPDTLGNVADALKATIDSLRSAISELGDLDPVSEDLCIGVSAQLEKHLWMVQAQEA
ncbi:MAG: DNA starvation/stationary phase protection protein Dps [Pirellulaceae bacterium]|nr:DNA starvation/stationary phase protection protein Dps [Pirellulaceae bacterium]